MGRIGSGSACVFGLSLLAGCGTAASTTSGTSGGSGGGDGAGTTTSSSTTGAIASVGSTGSGGGSAAACDPPAPAGSLWERNAETMAFEQVSMCQYRGDVLLIVNVAAL
jgi:hypothetical protein